MNADRLIKEMKDRVRHILKGDGFPEEGPEKYNLLRSWYDGNKVYIWREIIASDVKDIECVLLSFELYSLATNPLERADYGYVNNHIQALLKKLSLLENDPYLLSCALMSFIYDTPHSVQYSLAKKYYKTASEDIQQSVVYLMGESIYDLEVIDDTTLELLGYILNNYHEESVDWMKFYINNILEGRHGDSDKKRASLRGLLHA